MPGEAGTLRLDYIFSGNAKEQHIALHSLSSTPEWYGRKHNLNRLPVEGNGNITVTTFRGDTIYRNAFSTLFQEWVTYPEAQTTTRAFENTFLIPMPEDSVHVTVTLFDNRRRVTAQLTHTVRPDDILIRRIGEHDVTPYDVLSQPADSSSCINVAFVAEGYTEEEMPIFLRDATEAMEAIFAHEPFKALRDRFRIVAVKSVSRDSGASIPQKGVWLDTALSSSFDTFYSDRYLTTLHLFDLHDVLAGVPYEHIIVLVNTDNYGGGGILNSYNLSMTHHRMFKPVVVHEFGHSFGGLADEYAYESEQLDIFPTDIEPWEPNITTLRDFESKWSDMTTLDARNALGRLTVDRGEIGLYRGAGYNLHDIYRPTPSCRMRDNTTPDFCPVCQRHLEYMIRFSTEPVRH